MKIDTLTYLIRKAILEGAENKKAMPETNILNAEYASGKIHAYLDIICREYGYDKYVKVIDRIRPQLNLFLDRTEAIYELKGAAHDEK